MRIKKVWRKMGERYLASRIPHPVSAFETRFGCPLSSNIWRIGVSLLLIHSLTNETLAASSKTPKLRFSNKLTKLSGAGLQLKLLDKSREVPTATPTSFLYIQTMGETKTKIEMYSPPELWKLSQIQGKWIDKYANSLTLATMTQALPDGFSREHVIMTEYQAAIKASGGPKNKWTEAEMRTWVSDFLGVKNVTSKTLNKPSFKILKIIEFQVPSSATKISYAFQLNPKAASIYKPDDTWFFITMDINPKIRLLSARQTIFSSFLKSISAAKKSKTNIKNASSDFQSSKVDKGTGDSSEFLQSKQRVAASISNMKSWWYAETKNYIFLSNLGIRHKVFIKGMQEDLEKLRNAYAKLMPPETPISAVSVVRVFDKDAEYEEYVGPELKWSGGLWMSAKKEMVIRTGENTKSKQNRDAIRRTLYHEGFHQYIHYSLDQLHSSAWFNEGHAVFFENGTIKSRYFYAEEDANYIAAVMKMINSGKLDISSLLKMDYKAFYANSRKDNYALSWALVYYLRKYAPLEKPASYKNILDNYIKMLSKTRNPEKATTEAFKDVNMHNFEKNFRAFWLSKNKRGSAKRNLLFK